MKERATRLVLFAALVVLCADLPALAWGPLTHVQMAGEMLGRLALLTGAVAALLARHGRYFVFGNIAADVVFAKKLSRVKQVCHQWRTGLQMLESAASDEGRAFSYGYLSHLAADTVAHNKYLPHQMALCGSTVSFGHLYWEVRADAALDPRHWTTLRTLLRQRYPEPERMLETHLTRTLLPFGVNRRLFRRMNLMACARGWRRSVGLWSTLSRWPLDRETLGRFHAEALERIVSVLREGSASPVMQEDPNGNSALGYARIQRRQIRQLRRANLPVAHILLEAAANHAARPAHADGTTQPRATAAAK